MRHVWEDVRVRELLHRMVPRAAGVLCLSHGHLDSAWEAYSHLSGYKSTLGVCRDFKPSIYKFVFIFIYLFFC